MSSLSQLGAFESGGGDVAGVDLLERQLSAALAPLSPLRSDGGGDGGGGGGGGEGTMAPFGAAFPLPKTGTGPFAGCELKIKRHQVHESHPESITTNLKWFSIDVALVDENNNASSSSTQTLYCSAGWPIVRFPMRLSDGQESEVCTHWRGP